MQSEKQWAGVATAVTKKLGRRAGFAFSILVNFKALTFHRKVSKKRGLNCITCFTFTFMRIL